MLLVTFVAGVFMSESITVNKFSIGFLKLSAALFLILKDKGSLATKSRERLEN